MPVAPVYNDEFTGCLHEWVRKKIPIPGTKAWLPWGVLPRSCPCVAAKSVHSRGFYNRLNATGGEEDSSSPPIIKQFLCQNLQHGQILASLLAARLCNLPKCYFSIGRPAACHAVTPSCMCRMFLMPAFCMVS